MGEHEFSEIYQRLGAIEQTLARLEERLSAGAERRDEFKAELKRLNENGEDMERRIRDLESAREKIVGIMVGVSAVGSALGAVLSAVVGKYI